jgi:hypothetical protein
MKEILGIVSLALAIIGYIPYITNILRNKTKPHAFSWLSWAILAGIAFAVQLLNNGGPGAWLMGLTAAVTFMIFLLSFRYGEKNILFVDWASLVFAGLALLLWLLTSNPLTSIILISIIDVAGGFFPTFRKSITNPYEETAALYFMYGFSLSLSVAALDDFSLINALYPASFVVINFGMAAFLLVRRQILARVH